MNSDIFGVEQLPAEIKEGLQSRVDIILHKLKFFTEKPKIALLQQAGVTANQYEEYIKIAGGSLIAENSNWEEPLLQNPDIIIIALRGKDLTAAMTQMHDFFNLQGWQEASAVKNNKVYVLDSQNYLEQQGEKAVEALEALAEIITPRYFNFGLEGKAWLKFSM